ncbi:hypothetical protein [Rhizobium tumorigenes]|uniref:hypothetical protein n=1 Tax=Rhizobium tumorigenes TaxID=2041385 RepID=UPI00241D50E2|nr:hypothetical protein [Rhizobium tumorigenes]WFS02626.1 hypothetical protein PR016_08505 [Rhizobium tumorigenes]
MMIGSGIVASFYRYSVVFGLVALTLTGCKTIAEKQAEDARKRAAPTAVVMKTGKGEPAAKTLEYTKDGYPTFNGPLTAANVQIADPQALDIRKQLTAAGAARNSGAITQAQYDAKVAEMRKLQAEQQQTLSDLQK